MAISKRSTGAAVALLLAAGLGAACTCGSRPEPQQMIDAVAQQERAVAGAYFNFAAALLTLEEKVGGPVDADA